MSDIDIARELLEYRKLKSGVRFPWLTSLAITGLEVLGLVICGWVYFTIQSAIITHCIPGGADPGTKTQTAIADLKIARPTRSWLCALR